MCHVLNRGILTLYSTYFLWRYDPTILTVNYGIAFQAVDYQVGYLLLRFNYEKLGQTTSRAAAESIGIDPTNPWCFLQSLRLRTFFCTLAVVLAILIVPTLQNAAL